MQKAPALMGDWSTAGKAEPTKMLASITTVENRKLHTQAILVVRFQYSP